jgi:hypothetical protein
MVEKGWCRRDVNNEVGRIKRMFKWAVENELVPAERLHGLQAVPGLTNANRRENDEPRERDVAGLAC